MSEQLYCERCRRPMPPPQKFDERALIANLATEPAWKNSPHPDGSVGVVCPGCVTAIEQQQMREMEDDR